LRRGRNRLGTRKREGNCLGPSFGQSPPAFSPRPAFDAEAGLRPRPATVTVVKDDGMHEVRDVTVGVTDRVNAAILSGLNEGEKVVAGMQVAGADGGTQRQQRPNGFGAPGGVPGGLPGRIGGFR